MIPLTNNHLWWGRSEVVKIYPDNLYIYICIYILQMDSNWIYWDYNGLYILKMGWLVCTYNWWRAITVVWGRWQWKNMEISPELTDGNIWDFTGDLHTRWSGGSDMHWILGRSMSFLNSLNGLTWLTIEHLKMGHSFQKIIILQPRL